MKRDLNITQSQNIKIDCSTSQLMVIATITLQLARKFFVHK